MEQRTRAAIAGLAIGFIFLLVQLGALALVEPFKSGGFQTAPDPSDPTISIVYIGMILVATVAMLAAIRYDVEWTIRALIIFSGGYIAFIVLTVLVPSTFFPVFGVPILAYLGALALVVGLLVHPEWYVIDAAGVVMGAGAAGLFGVNFGVLPALVLLTILAVYDAISVYGTEHMLTLASGVMEMKVPVVLVVPLTLSYSFLDADMPDPTEDEEDAETASPSDEGLPTNDDDSGDGEQADTADEDEGQDEAAAPIDRDALFIGLGDAVIPTVLVASVAFFAPASVPSLDLGVLSVTLPAATAMVGTFVGLAILLWMVLKGRAHAGLPLLNGGTIAGYLLGALASGMSLVQAVGL